jgi:hypothetical protein
MAYFFSFCKRIQKVFAKYYSQELMLWDWKPAPCCKNKIVSLNWALRYLPTWVMMSLWDTCPFGSLPSGTSQQSQLVWSGRRVPSLQKTNAEEMQESLKWNSVNSHSPQGRNCFILKRELSNDRWTAKLNSLRRCAWSSCHPSKHFRVFLIWVSPPK